MAIIYSYPVVVPELGDLLLGTDSSAAGKPTKNFTIQSIVNILQAGATGLGAVLKISSNAQDLTDPNTPVNQPIQNLSFINGTGSATFNNFTDGTMNITGGIGTGFTSFSSTSFTGKIDAASFNQDNIRTLGILTNLKIGNATPAVTSIVTTLAKPGTDLALATTKAIVDYIAITPSPDTLFKTLQVGNKAYDTTIAGNPGFDIDMGITGTGGGNILFGDSKKIRMGDFGVTYPLEMFYGTDFSSTGNPTVAMLQNKAGGISGVVALTLRGNVLDLSSVGSTNPTVLPEKYLTATKNNGVLLYFNNDKKFETLTGGAKTTGTFEATGSGTFVNLLNTGTYQDSSGDVGTAGQLLSSTATGTNWVTDPNPTPYSWIIKGDTNQATVDVTNIVQFKGGDNITATLNAGTKVLTLDATGLVLKGTAIANQVTYWSNANTVDGDAGFTFAGGAAGKVTVAGELEAATLSDGIFSGTAGTYTGGVSIESDLFVGDSTASTSPTVQFQGNASSANRLGLSNNTIQLSAGTGATLGVGSNAVIYTTGQAITLTTTLQSTTVTGKVLTGLPTPAAETVVAADTILEGFGKLQSQINGLANGLQFQGTWNASMDTGGTDNTPGGTPNLTSGGGEASSGTTNATTANELVDSTKNFVIFPNVVAVGDKVINQVDGQTALVNSIANAASGRLGLASDIMLTGEAYIIDKSPFITAGHYYVVNAVGATTARNATLNSVQDWQIGDWVIASVTNVWQKLNNSAVEGAGTENRLPKWTAAVSTLVDSSVSDDGTTIKLLNDTELGTAAGDSIKSVGVLTTDEQLILKKGLGVGSTPNYGTITDGVGQVLTTGGSISAAPTWSTPTVGTVTEVALTETGNALTITGSPITGSGTINIAGAGDASVNQYINGELNLVTFPTLDNYQRWEFIGNSGGPDGVNSLETLTFAGNDGINTVASDNRLEILIETVGTDNAIEVLTAATAAPGDFMWFSDIDDSNTLRKSTLANLPFVPAVSGTQYTIPMFATSSTLDNSIISQNSGATEATISGDLNITGIYKKAGSQIALNDLSNAKTEFNSVFLGNIPASLDVAGGNSCIIIGYRAGNALTSGDNNVLIGKDAGLAVTAQGDNVFIGAEAGVANTLGSNIGIGSAALEASTNSGDNVAIGHQVAKNLTTGSKNIYIGSLVVAGAVDASREIVIGNQTTGNGSNTITLGDSVSTDFFGGKNGINIGSAAKPWGDLYVDDGFFDGNLTVDGTINHGGGGGGTAKGGTFTKLYTTGDIGVDGIAFTIERATSGSMVFDVMLTSDNSNTVTIAKKFTVVNQYGNNAPIFNKILDTGPDSVSDFAVAFETDGTSQTKIKCTITPAGMDTQKIGITIDLGFGQHDATVVMN